MTGNGAQLVLVSACVLIDPQGRVLIAQRPPGKSLEGLWELPGGKIEPGETPEAALVRELKEELGIEIEMGSLVPLTFASHSYLDFQLLMPLFGCRHWQGEAHPREHQELVWVTPEALAAYPMPPADEPLKRTLPALLRCWDELSGA